MRRHLALPILLLAAFLPWMKGCSVNPATGGRQLSLYSEAQEIELGREYDPQVLAQMGVYPDTAIQQYVAGLGAQLAAVSERPRLPWTFRVVDDPLVNAFAVPGGFIYITRGILAHLNSEAELVGILGHEIGHITARHSVNQLSRAQLTQLGIGVGMILRPELQQFGELASLGLGLLFLKYGRDAEYQSDDLGVRYALRIGYSPLEMAKVFRTLGTLTSEGGGTRPPEWASTHPFASNREERILTSVSAAEAAQLRVGRDDYLRRLDGLVYGENPREGFFRENRFLHPDLAFSLDFPVGWEARNGKTAVQAVSPSEDAVMQMDLADQATALEARSAFLTRTGIRAGAQREGFTGGLRSTWAEFALTTESGELRGLAGFIEHRGQVFRLLGYGTPTGWSQRGGAVRTSMESFREVTDRAILDLQPLRLEIVELPAAMSFADFLRRFPSSEEPTVVALINGVGASEALEAGRLMKRVVGTRP